MSCVPGKARPWESAGLGAEPARPQATAPASLCSPSKAPSIPRTTCITAPPRHPRPLSFHSVPMSVPDPWRQSWQPEVVRSKPSTPAGQAQPSHPGHRLLHPGQGTVHQRDAGGAQLAVKMSEGLHKISPRTFPPQARAGGPAFWDACRESHPAGRETCPGSGSSAGT